MIRGILSVGASIALALPLAACGSEDAATAAAEDRTVRQAEFAGVPATLAGLDVVPEDVESLIAPIPRPSFDEVAFYGLRREDELQATLQVGHFAPEVDLEDEDFTNALLAQLGSTRVLQLEGREVHLTVGNGQLVAAWFASDDLLVLSVREAYERPRELLRVALGLEP